MDNRQTRRDLGRQKLAAQVIWSCWALCLPAALSAQEAPSFTLDVDQDGQVQPLTDGLIVLRHLFGFSGSALITGALGENSARFEAEDIQEVLESKQSALDIDGDGETLPLTDGLLILRHLFGFSNEALISGAYSPAATRVTSEAIVEQIATIIDSDGDGIVDSLEDRVPVLTLVGAARLVLTVGEDYFEPGAVAEDREDGDLTAIIEIVGNAAIDVDLEGTYVVVYSVTDSAGNATEVERTVEVKPAVEEFPVLKAAVASSSPFLTSALLGAEFDIIGAFDAGINYNSCENDEGEGCPNIGWSAVEDGQRGMVLQVEHSSAGQLAGLYIKTGQGKSLDLGRFARGKILFDVRLISGDPKMIMKIDCGYPCTSGDYPLADASLGSWVTYEVELNDLVAQGLELRAVDTGLVIWAARHTDSIFQLDNVRWQANPEGPGDGFIQVDPPGTDWVKPNAASGFEAPTSYPGYELLFADEFDAPTIDTTVWNFEVNGYGGGNSELQFYRAENAYLREGQLVIEAREEEFAGKQYTSARMTTENKLEFTYGRIDIRALLPTGQGLWPALWMLGANFSDVGWPASGEIDIMELLGQRDNNAFGTVHWSESGNKAQYPNGPSGITLTGDETFNNQYHVFSLVWSETELEWLIDGESFQKFTITDSASLQAFRKAFFLIFNIAVGGNLPGSPSAETEFPQYMHVDYVRIYQQQ